MMAKDFQHQENSSPLEIEYSQKPSHNSGDSWDYVTIMRSMYLDMPIWPGG